MTLTNPENKIGHDRSHLGGSSGSMRNPMYRNIHCDGLHYGGSARQARRIVERKRRLEQRKNARECRGENKPFFS